MLGGVGGGAKGMKKDELSQLVGKKQCMTLIGSWDI
jgi:hypothetical protein